MNSRQVRASSLALIPQCPLGPQMAGPGWRYWKLAETLSKQLEDSFEVTLLVPPGSHPPTEHAFRLLESPPGSLWKHLSSYQFLLTQGSWVSPLRDGHGLSQTRLLLDFYDPLPVELPAHYAALADASGSAARYRGYLRKLKFLLRQSETFLVANPRQRDLLLGMGLAAGRFELRDFSPPGRMEQTFLEVPCGTEDAVVSPDPEGLRLAWGGGCWSWFDTRGTLELIRSLFREDSGYRLVIPGTTPPGPASQLADASGMIQAVNQDSELSQAVELHPGWMERPRFLHTLSSCQVGLSLAPEGLESHFSHRTRVLDYLTAGLPCVFSGGDPLAREAEAEGWGRSISLSNLSQAREAVRGLAESGPVREKALVAVARARERRHWERVVQPLVHYLQSTPSAPGPSPRVWNQIRSQVERWI